jgi:hypothetical protein
VFFKRNFIGHLSGDRVDESIIEGDIVQEISDKIWDISEQYISKEVEINGEDIQWSINEHPARNEIDKFVLLQDKKMRRNYCPSKLTLEILRHFRDKEINVLIHTYSRSISAKGVWNKVKKNLIDPENRDRAGASNTQSLKQLADNLMEIHGHHLAGLEISWMIWANAIQSSSAHLQCDMTRELPPSHIIHLFRCVPTSEASRLSALQHGVTIAESVNQAYGNDIAAIRNFCNNLRKMVIDAFDDIDRRLEGMESRNNSNGNLLSAVGTASRPVESEFSVNIASMITDQEDVDHADI